MATDRVPAAVPGPPDPPSGTPTTQTGTDKPAKGFLAAMVAPVEPARATFDLTPTTGHATHPEAGDGVLDRSAPGKSSASFHDTEQAATNDPTGKNRKAQGSIWKAWWLAGAQRWAKGGGTANKRLDFKKAQAQANQVKEARTTTVNKSGGLLPVRNSGGSGAGPKGNSGKSGGNAGGKGPVNSSGSRSNGAGRGGSGGGRGPGGGAGSNGSSSSGGRHKDSASHGKNTGTKGPSGGKGAAGTGGSHGAGGPGKHTSSGKDAHGGKDRASRDPKASKDTGAKGPGKAPGSGGGSGAASGGSGKQGAAGKSGTTGKDGKAQGPGTAGGSGTGAAPKADTAKPTTKHGKDDSAKPSKTSGKNDTGTRAAHKTKHSQGQPDTRTPLEKSRETGHKDGSAVRQVVDHVKAYKDGAIDGYHDKRDENARDHARLDKAHDKHKPKTTATNGAKTQAGRPQPVIVTEQEDDGVTTDVKPLTVQSIDANTLTLGADATRATYGRRELRNFKQYERKLEAKETNLQKIADACKQLEKEAEKEAKDCQDLLEQAKSVEGGEKLVAKLTKLADEAKNQTAEAAELAKRAKRSAEMCKVVLTNIQTRYAPLYKAVVDSDETKPAELRFYNDKGTYAPAA